MRAGFGVSWAERVAAVKEIFGEMAQANGVMAVQAVSQHPMLSRQDQRILEIGQRRIGDGRS